MLLIQWKCITEYFVYNMTVQLYLINIEYKFNTTSNVMTSMFDTFLKVGLLLIRQMRLIGAFSSFGFSL